MTFIWKQSYKLISILTITDLQALFFFFNIRECLGQFAYTSTNLTEQPPPSSFIIALFFWWTIKSFNFPVLLLFFSFFDFYWIRFFSFYDENIVSCKIVACIKRNSKHQLYYVLNYSLESSLNVEIAPIFPLLQYPPWGIETSVLAWTSWGWNNANVKF